MKILIEKIYPDAKAPTYAFPGDAGMDFYAYGDFSIKSGEKVSIPTGIKIAIPNGHVGLVWDKSGMAFKRGLKSMGGVVDAGYRGEVSICLINLSNEIQEIKKGEKVAQMLIQPVISVELEEGNLIETERGANAFGSTGK